MGSNGDPKRRVRWAKHGSSRARGHFLQHLSNPETVLSMVFVIVGIAALIPAFFVHAGILESDPRFRDSLIAVGLTVMLAGLAQVLSRLVRLLVVRGKRKAFNEFFGEGELKGVVPALSSAVPLNLKWEPPGSNGARPGGTDVVAYNDLEAAISLADLFEDFDVTFEIDHHTAYDDHTPPHHSFVSLGLGFNKLTCMLARMSGLVTIVYSDTHSGVAKDDYLIENQAHAVPGDDVDYALIIRVPMHMDGSVRPAIACAGRRALGTAVAGLFLKERWTELYDLYETRSLENDALVVEIEYCPSAVMRWSVVRKAFSTVAWNAEPVTALETSPSRAPVT